MGRGGGGGVGVGGRPWKEGWGEGSGRAWRSERATYEYLWSLFSHIQTICVIHHSLALDHVKCSAIISVTIVNVKS